MKELICIFWNKFKNQPDTWFFFIFLLTFSLSIRKVIFYFPIQGTFNEYSGIYVYISDIALILTLILWLISILCNNSISLSSIKLWIKSVFGDKYIILPIFLIFLSFLSISWSENKSISLFRSIKLLEFYLLYIYIIFRIVPQMFHVEHLTPSLCKGEGWSEVKNVPRGTLEVDKAGVEHSQAGGTFHLFSWIIIFLGLFQGTIGIIQFLIQKSIDLFWLRESLVSPEILGVAKIILNGETYIRAYGLMPHPNILGGFLLFSIIISLLYKKIVPRLFETKIFNACPKQECSTWNILGRVEHSQASGTIWIFRIILLIQIIALFLTFSKSAIIGLLIALIYINCSPTRKRIVPPASTCGNATSTRGGRGTILDGWNILKRMEHSKALLLSGLIILVFLFLIIKPNLNSLLFKSLNERIFYLNVPRETFLQDPILGVGAGQSVLIMQDFYPQNLNFWKYQPVHNVFLLILSELGSIGLFIFIWWLWKLFHTHLKQECSTPARNNNVPRLSARKLFHVEQFQEDGTLLGGWNNFGRMGQFRENGTLESSSPLQGEELKEGLENKNSNILSNNNTYLSSIISSHYFKGILLGLIFIMLFDHYLWDIQQGSLLFWIIAGFIAGINKK